MPSKCADSQDDGLARTWQCAAAMRTAPAALLASLPLLFACGGLEGVDGADPTSDVSALDGSLEGFPVDAAQAASLVELANRATEAQLRRAGLDTRQATSIASSRPIGTIDELAAVPYVGPAAARKLIAFLPAWDGGEALVAGGGFHDGVAFGPVDEAIALDAARRATRDELVVVCGIAPAQAATVVGNRPAGGYASLAAVAAVRGVGTVTMRRLLDAVRTAAWELPVVRRTQQQALEAARSALILHLVNDVQRSEAYQRIWGGDAAAAHAFRRAVWTLGTPDNPLDEVIVTESGGWTFVGRLVDLYAEATVEPTGEVTHVLIEID